MRKKHTTTNSKSSVKNELLTMNHPGEEICLLNISSLKTMLKKLEPLDDMGCVNFKRQLKQFIEEFGNRYHNVNIEGIPNGLFQQFHKYLEKGRKFELILEKKNQLIYEVELLVDEGIQNPAKIEEIEEIHKSIISDLRWIDRRKELVPKYVSSYSQFSITSGLLIHGISDDMKYFDLKERKDKGMKLLCCGADFPLHGYIPLS